MKKTFLFSILFICFLKLSYAQAGYSDSSFGINGVIRNDLGVPYNYSFSNSVVKVLLANDGSIFTIVEANSETLISKRKPDGSIDPTYRNKGFSDVAIIRCYAAAMQPDGKIIVAGTMDNTSNGNFEVARYNTDGSLDKTFSSDGYQSTAIGAYSFANSLALQNDGKIILAGYSDGDFALVRYNGDGSLDKTFSQDGKQTTDFASSTDLITSVVVQKDGRIVAAGFTFNGSNYDFALARYNTDGSLDNSFSQDGKQTTSFGGNDYAYSAAIQRNGKIVVAGYTTLNTKSASALARYNLDGSLDSSFDGDGKETTGYGAEYSTSPSIAIQADDKIVVAYYVLNGSNSDFGLSRYNANGGLDKIFSGDGKQTTAFNHNNGYANTVAIQKDGKIVVGGGVEMNGSTDFALCRYDSKGSGDSTFGKDGKVLDRFKQGYTEYKSAAIQKDGKIVVAGFTWNGKNFDFGVARYNINGNPDTTFSGDGIESTSFGASDGKAYSVAIQDDGKIVAAGISDNKCALIRLTSSGTPDNTFSGDGRLTTDYGSGYSIVNSIALQYDGKIIVAGSSADSFALARYNPGGALDKSFANNGKITGSFGYLYNSANSVTVQNDGKIILAGNISNEQFTTGFALARFTKDGRPDTIFGKTGIVIAGDDLPCYANSVLVRSNGKILTGGSCGSHSSITCLNANGTPDSSFGDNGRQIVQLSAQEDVINHIVISNNKLYAVGYAQSPGHLGTVLKFLINDNIPPTISLTTPVNHDTFIAPANIRLNASATDKDGTISKVEFYSDTTLLHTEYQVRYDFKWQQVPHGNYTLTAKVTDNGGLVTTSAPLHISVVDPPPTKNITSLNNGVAATVPATSVSIQVGPNPAKNILNIYTTGLQKNKQLFISVISASGVIIKTKQSNSSDWFVSLDISPLAPGVYTIKVLSGDRIMYKQFIKL